MYHLTFWQH